jgi:hypothetical protein
MRRVILLPFSFCMLFGVPALAQEPAAPSHAGHSGHAGATSSHVGAMPSHAVAAPTTTEHVFDITRDGNKIGTDTIDVTKAGDTTTIQSTTHIEVTVAFIKAYSFDHVATEKWAKGHFVSYKAHTNDNGKKYDLLAKVVGQKTDLTVNGEETELPQVVLPASLWNQDFVNATQLIDTDKGKVMSVAVQDVGDEAIEIDGTQVQAHHYKITGDFERDVWVADGVPVRISLHGSDHSLIVSNMRQQASSQ